MDAIAITDHGVMYGVVDFWVYAKEAGVKPIIGCEVYVSRRGHKDKDPRLDSDSYHLVLLVKNAVGYQNLIKLVSAGFVDGFYYKPRIDYELLAAHSEGLIGLSACLGGEIPKALLEQDYNIAKEKTLRLNEIFGMGNFYIELQDHGIEEQQIVNPQLLRISKETGIPLVATNDCHYVERTDSEVQDVLLCIQTGKNVEDTGRMRFKGSEFYLKSGDEMSQLFPYAPEAIENSCKIADQCDFSFNFGEIHLPEFSVPEGFDSNSYIRFLAEDGLKDRYEKDLAAPECTSCKELMERLEYELSVITRMGYADYYLIVYDYVRFAREAKIMVGPGRGSGAGSLVAYCLGITNIDPIKYNLIFERFLNPERISMPDFDVDFCFERRQEVIDYVIEKYGKDRVAQIITFGTMAARAAIRDIGRALAVPYASVDAIAKKIPMEIGMTIEKALEVNHELRQLYESDEEAKKLLDFSMAVEGMPRHASTHAAGVVISKKAVTEYVPLQTNDDVITTQFPMGTLEKLGLLKMDFLGLRTLTVIRDAVKMIEDRGIEVPDLDRMDFDDEGVYQLISAGDTYGIFQLESTGMTKFMKELKPENLEDIIAGISLYRPGPMDQIPRYIKNKNNPAGIKYLHPMLEPIMSVTYGCVIYQEQVMQVFRDLGGYSLGRSDLVRRVMSKKKMDVMALEKKNFIHGIVDEEGNVVVKGCIRNGISEEIATAIFDELAEFAKYGFNKSHAAAYAIIAYQTAWLKRFYPVEFTAALITSVMGNSVKVAEYIAKAKIGGINLLPPDVNESGVSFTVKEGYLRFGLAAVKNVGYNAIAAIIRAKEGEGKFLNLYDFVKRVDSNALNKRTVESLIKAGAMDSFGTKRSQMLEVYERILDSVSSSRKGNPDQISMFDGMGEADPVMQEMYPDMEEYPSRELLMMEKEMLGLYISGHPLEEFSDELAKYTNMSTADLNISTDIDDEMGEGGDASLKEAVAVALDGAFAKMAGIITSVKMKSTRNNSMMAFVELEDMYGSIEIIVFPKVLATYTNILKEDEIVLVEGRISQREDEGPKLLLDRIKPMKKGETTDFEPKFGRRSYNNNYNGQNNNGKSSNGQYNNGQNYNGQNNNNTNGKNGENKKAEMPNGGAVSPENTCPPSDGKKLYVRINSSREPVAVSILSDSIKDFPGNMPVIIVDSGKMENGKPTVLASDQSKWVSNDERLINDLKERFGAENVVLR